MARAEQANDTSSSRAGASRGRAAKWPTSSAIRWRCRAGGRRCTSTSREVRPPTRTASAAACSCTRKGGCRTRCGGNSRSSSRAIRTVRARRANGDFNGRGEWTFVQEGRSSTSPTTGGISAEKPLLRNLSFLLKPLFEANHRWAMAQGETSLKLELRGAARARMRRARRCRRRRRQSPTPASRSWRARPPSAPASRISCFDRSAGAEERRLAHAETDSSAIPPARWPLISVDGPLVVCPH